MAVRSERGEPHMNVIDGLEYFAEEERRFRVHLPITRTKQAKTNLTMLT